MFALNPYQGLTSIFLLTPANWAHVHAVSQILHVKVVYVTLHAHVLHAKVVYVNLHENGENGLYVFPPSQKMLNA